MPLFGFKKNAKTVPIAATPTDKSLEDEIAEMERQLGVTNDKLGTEWGRKKSVSDEELERELEAMMITQNGKSRGGDRIAALRAMIQNSINQIKVLKQSPATPETLEAQNRLLEIAKKLNAELQQLKKRGAKRKRATRRKRVRRSS
jgi:hypothetical protein